MGTAHHIDRQMRRRIGYRLLLLLIFLLFLYVVLPQMQGLSFSRHTVQPPHWEYIWLAAALTAATYVVAAAVYQVLALKPLKYLRTLLVQVATAFTTRLLPAGIGAIGLNVLYLHREQHTVASAGVVVAANNLTGVAGHIFIVLLAVTFGDVGFDEIRINTPSLLPFIIGGVIILAVLLVARLTWFKKPMQQVWQSVRGSILQYRRRPKQLLAGLLVNLLLTLVYVGILWACTRALGVEMSLSQVLIVFTMGSVIGTATPTPGGVVGAEAALFAGFVAYGVNSETALAIALLYRLLTYWLPLIPGVIAFIVAQSRFRLLSGDIASE